MSKSPKGLFIQCQIRLSIATLNRRVLRERILPTIDIKGHKDIHKKRMWTNPDYTLSRAPHGVSLWLIGRTTPVGDFFLLPAML